MTNDTRDALEPDVATPATGLVSRVQRSDVWRSMFRHPQLDTARGRALQSFSNFFLHLYPVKVPPASCGFGTRSVSGSSPRCCSRS